MTLKRKMDSPESKEFWEFADKMLERVETYPDWKKGGENVQSNGDKEHSDKSNNNGESERKYNLR